MAIITVFIGGIDRSLLVDRRGSRLSYDRDINGQGNARFTLADVPSGFVPDDGMEVLIKEDGVDRFGGIINGRPRGFRGPDSASQLTFYSIAVASWEQRLNKRRVWREYDAVLFETIVADLNTDFLSSEGITLSVLAGTAQTITFNGETVAEAMDLLCSLETDGRTWYVTAAKVLTVDVQAATPAPVTLNARNLELNNPAPTIEPDRTGYANQITVVGGNPDLQLTYTARDAGEITARAAAEGGSGIYHDTVEDNEARTENQVTVRAEGILLQRKRIRQRFVGMTNISGFNLGQQVTVNLPNLGFSDKTFFILSISTTVSPGVNELWHTITAVDNLFDGSWQSEYRRKIQRRTIPMQVEAAPGIVRVEPKAGVLIHDPERDPTEWFQGTLSGTLDQTPSGIGVSADGRWLFSIRRGGVANTGGCSGGLFPGFGTCHVNRQTIFEAYPITNNQPATTPTRGASWDEIAANANFKTTVAASPDGNFLAVQQYGAPGRFIVVDLLNRQKTGDVSSDVSNQGDPGEPVWVGDHIYWPNVSDGKIYIYDASDKRAPTEAAVFVTSLTTCTCVVAAPNGVDLYACGEDGLVGLDATAPAALVEDDSLATTGDYFSIGFDERNILAAALRVDAANVRLLTVQTTGTTLALVAEALVALATGQMDGIEAVHARGSVAVWSERDVVGANDLDLHVFDTTDATAVAFIETIPYTHAAAGNVGPAKTVAARKVVYTFNSNDDSQVAFGVEAFDKIVPYEIEIPLRGAFGGTGFGDGDLVKGDLLVAQDLDTLGRLAAVPDGALLRTNSDETTGLEWEHGLRRGHIDGLETSNAADADHDVTVAEGACADSLADNDKIIELIAAITKQIDAAWAKGTDLGGMATGAVAADTHYNLIVIEEDSSGDVDMMFDVDAAGANAPSGWTARRRIGSVFTDGSANIRDYLQFGDYFRNVDPPQDLNDATGTFGVFETATLQVPPNQIGHLAVNFGVDDSGAGLTQVQGFVRHPATQDDFTVESMMATMTNSIVHTGPFRNATHAFLPVDGSSQVEYSLRSAGAGATWEFVKISILGWLDQRGRNA